MANLELFTEGNQAAVGHGAPLANQNAQTHGLRSLRASRSTTLPALPDYKITREAQRFRRNTEAHVLEAHGRISYQHELAINSATRHEAAALLIARWLRLKSETMTHAERLSYITALARESDLRDKSIDRLNLDDDPQTLYGSLYGAVVTPLDGPGSDDQ